MAEKTEKKTAKLSGQERIRIKLRSYDYRMLDNSVARIVDTARKTGAIVACSFTCKNQKVYGSSLPSYGQEIQRTVRNAYPQKINRLKEPHTQNRRRINEA